MPPPEQVSPGFDWVRDRRDAHAKLRDASPDAASALAKALDSAGQMADLCQRLIARGPAAWQDQAAPPPSWVDFLEALSNDADSFYPDHLRALSPDLRNRLLKQFRLIAETALEAQTRITMMPRPTPETTKKAVVTLRNLMRELKLTERILAPLPVREVTDLPRAGTKEKTEISAAPEAALVPVIGRIAAGSANVAEQEVEGVFPLPRQVVGFGTLFILRVYSHSMTGAGIMEGDWVVIRQQQDAIDGEIVVALVDGDATLKKYRVSDGQVTLVATNPLYEDIPGNSAKIMGKVVAVLREL